MSVKVLVNILIHARIKMINATIENQTCVLYVDQRITVSQIFQTRKIRTRYFTGTWKSRKLGRTDQQKEINNWRILQNETSCRKYTRIWNVCLPT